MKKFLFITLLALVCSVSGYAQEHTELLESAKEKFAAGEYKSAELKLDTYIDLSGDASQSSLMTNIKMCLNILEKAEAEREANGFSDVLVYLWRHFCPIPQYGCGVLFICCKGIPEPPRE